MSINNEQLRVDLASNARDLFVATYSKSLEIAPFPPSMEDKPVSLMAIEYNRSKVNISDDGPEIVDEKLKAFPYLRERNFLTDKQDVYTQYRLGVSESLARVALYDGINLSSVIPSNGIDASYFAFEERGSVISAASYDSSSKPESLNLAIDLTKIAISEIESSGEERTVQDKI